MAYSSGLICLLAAIGQAVESPLAEAERQERLDFLTQKAMEFTLYREPGRQPLVLREKAVLRYSIPERDNGTWDGATFLWLEGSRPVAALALGIRKPNNAVVREQTSFSSSPLICERSGAAAWTPPGGGLLNQPFPGKVTPADSDAGRLVQMRTLARRFSATCYRREDATELRLMPQPLYRYSDEKAHILDGGLFGLAAGNDAEILLLVEAVSDSTAAAPHWRYSVARMSSLQLSVRLDDAEIAAIPRFYSIPSAERKLGQYVEVPMGTYGGSAAAATDQK